jgi:quinol monooxygenase YgiN
MVHVQVTYRIRSGRLEEAGREIADFVESLRAGPERYENYHILRHAGDSASFVHWMQFRDHEAQQEHVQSPHVRRFVENMLALCEAGPVYNDLNPVAELGNGADIGHR